MLAWGSCCKERSIKTKAYVRKDSVVCRVEYCVNVGCGYKRSLTREVCDGAETVRYA